MRLPSFSFAFVSMHAVCGAYRRDGALLSALLRRSSRAGHQQLRRTKASTRLAEGRAKGRQGTEWAADKRLGGRRMGLAAGCAAMSPRTSAAPRSAEGRCVVCVPPRSHLTLIVTRRTRPFSERAPMPETTVHVRKRPLVGISLPSSQPAPPVAARLLRVAPTSHLCGVQG